MTTKKKFPISSVNYNRQEEVDGQLRMEPVINPDDIRLVDEKLMGDDKDIADALDAEDTQRKGEQDYSRAENNRTDIEED